MSRYNWFVMKRNYLTIFVCIFLFACSGADDKKADYFEKAEKFYESGSYDKARVELQNVLQIDPKDIPARYLLAQVLEKTQDYGAAVQHYNGILAQDETHIDARIKLGEFYLLSQNFEQAKEHAKKALSYDSDNANALAFRGTIFLKQNDYISAKEDADRALLLVPGNLKATLLQANILNVTNKKSESIDLLNQAIDLRPNNLLLRNLLASIYLNMGKNDKAIEQIQFMVKKHPDVLYHRLKLADVYFASEQKDKAEASIRQAVKDFPDNNEIKLSLIKYISSETGEDAAIKELNDFISSGPDNYALKFILAGMHENNKQSEKAIEIYKDVLEKEKLSPNGLNARIYLAELAFKAGKNEEAKSLLSEVLAETPNNHTALALRGKIFLTEGNSLSAISDFRSAMRDQPNSIVLLRSLAKAHLNNNELDLAIDVMKRAVKLREKDLVLREEYIKLLAIKGDVENVIAQLDDILLFEPNNLGAMEALFKVHASRKDWNALEHISNKMKETHPNNAIGYYYSGLQLQGQKKYLDSIKDFQQAIKRSPDSAEPVTQLVRSYLSLNKNDLALESLNEIIKNNESNIFARNLKGEVYLFNKDIDAAINEFESVILLKPDWHLAYQNLAKSHLINKEEDEAVRVYDRGIKATNFSAVLVADLARYFEAKGELDKAIKLYEEVLANDNSNKLATNNLAMLLIDYKGDDVSLGRAEKLIQTLKDINNPAYLDTIGWLYFKKNEFNKAVQYLEKAVAAAPGNAGLNYHLGMAYFKSGMNESARDSLVIATESGAKFLGLDEANKVLESL